MTDSVFNPGRLTRLLLILSAMLLAVCLLTACGGKTPAETTDTSDDRQTSDDTQPADPGTESGTTAPDETWTAAPGTQPEPETEYEPPRPELETDPPLADVPLDALPVPAAQVLRADRRISLDGSLADWADVPHIPLYGIPFDREGTPFRSAGAYMMMLWDEDEGGIYLACFIPDTTRDTDASSLRDWFSMSYHFGDKTGALAGQYIVCTINCDCWHPGLSNYDVNEQGGATGLVADGTTRMNFTYLQDGVVVETYMPLTDEARVLLREGTEMHVAVRYDDGRVTDYTSQVARTMYVWGDNDHSLYNDVSVFGTVTFSGRTPAEAQDGITEDNAYEMLGALSCMGLLRKADYGYRDRLSETPTQKEAFDAAAGLFALTPDALGAELPDLAPAADAPADGAYWLSLLLGHMGYLTDDAVKADPVPLAKTLGILPESGFMSNGFTFSDLFRTAAHALTANAADGRQVLDGMVRAHLVNSSAAVASGLYERPYEGYTTADASDPDYEPLVVPSGAVLVTPEDFGAVGDGIADDGPAIEAMFAYAAAHADGNVLIRFGKGRTYAARSYTDSQYLIRLTDVSHVWVDGQGALIRLTYPVLPMWIQSVKDVHVSGLYFEYDPCPFVEGRITDVNTRKQFVTFTTTADLGLAVKETWETDDPVFFALPDLEYTRGFINIYKYERVDETTYRAFSKDLSVASCSENWVFPVPGAAHLGSTAEAASYHIYYSEDVTLSNIRIYSNIYFTFSVAGNTGKIRFVNVDLKPREDAPVQLIAAWRDGFHCKENRAPIIWERCYVGNLGDDAFNICSTLQRVKRTRSSADGTVYTLEGIGQFAQSVILPGDEFDAYNVLTGAYIGRGCVKTVLSQEPKQIVLENDLPGLDTTDGVRLAFVSLAAPGSEIIGCTVKGTVRFKGPITVRDTTFDILEMWEMVEGDTEGPIPRGVVFENCSFTHGLITCDAVNRETGASFPSIAKQIEVTFTDCTFENGARVARNHGAGVTVK